MEKKAKSSQSESFAYIVIYAEKSENLFCPNSCFDQELPLGQILWESECAISRSDLLAKIYIALKETAETIYWLDLLYQTDYLTEAQYNSLFHDAEEMRRMLSSSTKTMQQNKTPHSTLHTPH